MARRAGTLQSSDVLLFEPNRGRNQPRHTITIHVLGPERNPPAWPLLASASARTLVRRAPGVQVRRSAERPRSAAGASNASPRRVDRDVRQVWFQTQQ